MVATIDALERADLEEQESPFHLTDVDKWVLAQTDDTFHLHQWEELKEIIATNNLDTLKRKPSQLRLYINWARATNAEYGSTTSFLLKCRLHWAPPPFTYISPVPFQNLSDFKILVNDWPYGLAENITHIVAWSKTPIATDDKTGDMTDSSRQIIGRFVERTFVDRLGGDHDRVLWFKNWVALQSVRALEHVHILVRDASKEDLEYWTEGRYQRRV